MATLVGVQLGRLLYRQRLLPWKGLYALIAVQVLAFAALLGTAVVASASSSLRHTGGDAVGIRLNRSLAASLLVVAALLCGLPYGYAVCHVFGDAVARRFQVRIGVHVCVVMLRCAWLTLTRVVLVCVSECRLSLSHCL